MFEPFQNFITKAARRRGISTEVQAAQVCHQFRDLIPALFPDKESAREYCDAAFYKNHILVINTKTPGWAQEIIMRKEKIIAEMNQKLGTEIIKNLRTQISS